MNTEHVGKSSWIIHPITGKSDVILEIPCLRIGNVERSHINVTDVGDPLVFFSALKNMKELTTERNCINMRNVEEPSYGSKSFKDTW